MKKEKKDKKKKKAKKAKGDDSSAAPQPSNALHASLHWPSVSMLQLLACICDAVEVCSLPTIITYPHVSH